MLFRILLTTLALTAVINAPQLHAGPPIHDLVDSYSAAIYDELVEIRRDLYEHPEASGEEKRTSAVVAHYLANLGLDVKTNIGGYGVVGILKGAKEGKHIAWRADMDAAYHVHGDEHEAHSGEHQVGHICGHDVHTTIGLGIANVLSQNADNLAGTVYFLFQPAEETQKGAKAMINDGLFELIEPDEIYALHVGPMETGIIATRPGNVFSHARTIRLSFDANEDYEELKSTVNVVFRSLVRITSVDEFVQLQNTSDPSLGLANPDTIYKDYVTFDGDPYSQKLESSVVFQTQVFTTDQAELDTVVQRLKQLIEATKFKDRLRSVKYFDEREGVHNDPALVRESLNTVRDFYGQEAVQQTYGQVPFASEDFGHFQNKVPGVYFLLGAGNAKQGITAFPHMPNFSVDESSIDVGVRYFSTLIIERLKRL